MKDKLASGQVLEALRNGPFRTPAHSWLYEVRNGTGYEKSQRYADALVVSVWPSRGIWIAGIEVKVSRSDWRKELDDPSKADAIQKYCDYWWIAAAEDVVKPTEVPERWGFIEVNAKGKASTVREAPKLTPEPLDKLFIASILRNQADALETAKGRGRDEAWTRLKSEFDQEAVMKLRGELNAAETAKDQAERRADQWKKDIDRLKETVGAFEQEAGLPKDTVMLRSWQENNAFGAGCRHKAGAVYKAAQLLAAESVGGLAKRFHDVADALDAVTTRSDQESA